jgi:hypothetical protein
MESILNFIQKLSEVVRTHLDEAENFLGKEIVDMSARRCGVVVDRIKRSFGARFSLLNNKYSPEELRQIESFDDNVIVCQNKEGKRFFLPESELAVIGESLILVNKDLSMPEFDGNGKVRNEIFRRYFTTQAKIKMILPKVEKKTAAKTKKKKALHFFLH